ncbi:MAG: hypothetical protein WBM62_06205 [Crocosphaera sp.]
MSDYDSSSTLPEIQQRQMRLQYRRDWLEALLKETERELKLLFKVEELTEEHQPDIIVSDRDVLSFVNKIFDVLLEFETVANSPEEIENRKEQLQYYRACFQYLLDSAMRELDILAEIIQSMSNAELTVDEVSG